MLGLGVPQRTYPLFSSNWGLSESKSCVSPSDWRLPESRACVSPSQSGAFLAQEHSRAQGWLGGRREVGQAEWLSHSGERKEENSQTASLLEICVIN